MNIYSRSGIVKLQQQKINRVTLRKRVQWHFPSSANSQTKHAGQINTVEIVYNEHEDQAEFACCNRFSL